MNSFKDFKHNVPVLGGGQKTYQQCWFASYQMLLKYHSQSTDTIEPKLTSNGIDVPDALSLGMSDKKYFDAGKALGMTMWSGERFKKDPSWYDVGLTDGAEEFIEELAKGPLWVSRFIEEGTYHATLAIGFKWGFRDTGYIIYNNPYPGPKDAIEKFDLTANQYVRHITSAKGSVQAFRN